MQQYHPFQLCAWLSIQSHQETDIWHVWTLSAQCLHSLVLEQSPIWSFVCCWTISVLFS